MSQDIVEEAKQALASPNKLKFHATFWMNLAVDLKDEVERLRSLEAMVSKELFTGDGELTVEQFKAKMQIESLTKELAQADKDLKWTQSIFDKERETRKKLEAENAELKAKVVSLEQDIKNQGCWNPNGSTPK